VAKKTILAFFILLLFISCQSSNGKNDHSQDQTVKEDADVMKIVDDETAIHDGENSPVPDETQDEEIILNPSKLTAAWANNGQDKITQDEQRATLDKGSVLNSVWDGEKVSLFGAKNEMIAFNLILEAMSEDVKNIKVEISSLKGPGGDTISTKSVDCSKKGSEECLKLFNYVDRNIELFYIRYLQIKGLSNMAYDSMVYDERHVPKRFQRPFNQYYRGIGTWYDRPGHDKFYPDIAVPLELHTPFSIAKNHNQSIWSDIYIPKGAAPGVYRGTVDIFESSKQTFRIPIEVTVRNFELPDIPTAKTMLYYERGPISKRFTSAGYHNPGTDGYKKTEDVIDKIFQMTHRHKISLISDHVKLSSMEDRWHDKLSGELFTKEKGYEGVGEGTGNNVHSIGTYGGWRKDWSNSSKSEMWQNADAWVTWFNEKNYKTETEYFLYLIDESKDYEQTEKWAKWINENPGVGKNLLSFATLHMEAAYTETPSLDIVATVSRKIAPTKEMESEFEKQIKHYEENSDKRIYFYNGRRPWSGTYSTEDDGVALRVLAWSQYKFNIDRWFYWTANLYTDYNSGSGDTNVFQSAKTFGKDVTFEEDGKARGRFGPGYSNGDGVLLYPGRDMVFPEESYDLDGPIASLRLKLWRRGVQDVDYLALAEKIDPVRTSEIVEEIIPKVFWEYGAGDRSSVNDPTWVNTDISWSIDPDVWEAARKELADIIETK